MEQENPCADSVLRSIKLAELRSELVERAERALAKMNAVPNTSRRKRNSTALEQPMSKRLFVEDEQTSPAVVVSATFKLFTFYKYNHVLYVL